MPKKPKLREWPADQVIRAPIASIQPYPRNPRTHSDAQIKLLAQSIEQYGFTAPLLVDEESVLLYGHGRLLAAQMLGLEEVPISIARGWTDAEKSAYRIADNQLNLLSGWDLPMLKAELHDLSIDGSVELNSLGFPELQLGKLGFGLQMPGDPEATPELPAEPITKRGDLWVLGDHRLLCGDATSADDVAACLGNAKPNLMVTDPPYGVDYDADWRNRADRANGKPYGARAVGIVSNDDQSDWGDAWRLYKGDVAYCWHADRHASSVQRSLETADFQIVCQIVWAKTRLIISRGDYHWQHEPCWYAVRKGKKHHWSGDRSQTTLWTIDHSKSETGHSTQKPVECMLRPIQNNSEAGDYVYDPFVGSGTTIIAAEMTKRRCLAIEIDPRYVDVAVARWEQFTGKKAQRKPPRPKARGSLQCA